MAIAKLRSDADSDGEEDAGVFAEINITPLTDVFLVLVLIFMISSLAALGVARDEMRKKEEISEQVAAEKRSGLKINLPSGAAQEIDPTKSSIVLLVPVTGDVTIAGQAITDAEIDNVFRAAFAKDKLTQVVLQADRGVQHGRVVNLMERAKRVGLVRLVVGTSGGQ